MTNTKGFYDAKVSVRSQINLLSTIKCKLQPNKNRYSLFSKTVFGRWLDISPPSNDNHLLNYVLQHQVYVPQLSQDCPPIIYKIGDHQLHFGRREFCLITGFRCGQLVSETFSGQSPFCDRVFPHKRAKKTKNVKGQELWDVLENEKLWSELTDEDAVRVCLLLVAEVVFMGREYRFNLPVPILILVEDFAAWDAYPWGEYMWSEFYVKNVNVTQNLALKMKEKDPKKLATYNLNGFVWALKIWILESYPNSTFWWEKKPDVIPRCLAWSNVRKFQKSDHDRLFRQAPIPILDLDPTVEESEQAWWIDSLPFFSVQAVQGEVAAVEGFEEDRANDDIPVMQYEEEQKENGEVIDLAKEEKKPNEMMDLDKSVETSSPSPNDAVPREISAVQGEVAPFVHEVHAAEAHQIMEEVDALRREVNDYRPDLVDRIDELRTRVEAMESVLKLRTTVEVKPEPSHVITEQSVVVNHDTKTSSSPPNDAVPRDISAESMAIDQEKKLYYTDIQHSTMQHLIEACNFVEPLDPNVDWLNAILSSPPPNDAVPREMSFDSPSKDDLDIAAEEEKQVLYYEFPKEEKTPNEMIHLCSKKKMFDLDESIVVHFVCQRRSCMQRKRKASFKSLYVTQPPTTPRVPKRRSRGNNSESIEFPLVFGADGQLDPLKPFAEDLPGHVNCNRNKVTVPECIKSFLKKRRKTQLYRFPWGESDVIVDYNFWLALLCLDEGKKGWLLDDHLQIWVDLMWHFRAPDADWSMVDPYFCPSILRGDTPSYYANTKTYPVAWSDVEKVYFPLNEPENHWALAELQIRTGVITIYDSLAPQNKARQETRGWWSNMRKTLAINLPLYLNEHEVLKSKGIHVEDYKISFQFAKNVPRQATKYGDCGIWVCIFLYRLTHNLPLDGGDSLQVALAYRESMFVYLWKNKVRCVKRSKRHAARREVNDHRPDLVDRVDDLRTIIEVKLEASHVITEPSVVVNHDTKTSSPPPNYAVPHEISAVQGEVVDWFDDIPVMEYEEEQKENVEVIDLGNVWQN